MGIKNEITRIRPGIFVINNSSGLISIDCESMIIKMDDVKCPIKEINSSLYCFHNAGFILPIALFAIGRIDDMKELKELNSKLNTEWKEWVNYQANKILLEETRENEDGD